MLVFICIGSRRIEYLACTSSPDVLGFEKRIDNPTADGPRFLTVAVKGQDFQLALWPGTPGQAQPVEGRIPAAYTIETADYRKAFDALTFSFRPTCSDSNVPWVWSRLWSFHVQNCAWIYQLLGR